MGRERGEMGGGGGGAGAEEIAPLLTAGVARAQDSGSVPSTRVVAHNNPYNSRSRGLNTHFQHPWEPGMHAEHLTYMQAKHSYTSKKIDT